jgi:hypothetical protein
MEGRSYVITRRPRRLAGLWNVSPINLHTREVEVKLVLEGPSNSCRNSLKRHCSFNAVLQVSHTCCLARGA